MMTSPSYVPVIAAGRDVSFASVTVTGNATIGGTLALNNGALITFGAAGDVNLYRGGANLLQTDDYFVIPNGQSNGQFSVFGGGPGALTLGTATGGIAMKEGGGAARLGRAVLAAGTVVVANTSVTANTEVFATTQIPGGTPGAVYCSARNPGVSFTLTSTSGADTSTVGYHLIEPS
jgi:hypothetical protein